MGQFKPMVKMMTTEPTVELKLKKGGSVKKADGGMMGSPMSADMSSSMPSSMPARGGVPMGRAPMKPPMAMRRKAMMGRPMTPPMASPAPMSATPMKKGGKAEGGESKATHMSEMKAIKGIGKELKSHEGKPASKAHKGLKTGGVVEAQGGYKAGGMISKSGIINTEDQGGEYRNTKMHSAEYTGKSSGKTGDVKLGNGAGYKAGGGVKGQGIEGNVSSTPPGVTNMKTGDVRLSNAGGYKKGGSAKKYARGGAVVQDDGKAQKMSQGQKKPSAPVSINALSGTFKKGGSVRKMAEGGDSIIDRETARMNAEKASEKSGNQAMREAILGAPSRALERVKGFFGGVGNKPDLPAGSVTKTKESVTVAPSKKRGGSVRC